MTAVDVAMLIRLYAALAVKVMTFAQRFLVELDVLARGTPAAREANSGGRVSSCGALNVGSQGVRIYDAIGVEMWGQGIRLRL